MNQNPSQSPSFNGILHKVSEKQECVKNNSAAKPINYNHHNHTKNSLEQLHQKESSCQTNSDQLTQLISNVDLSNKRSSDSNITLDNPITKDSCFQNKKDNEFKPKTKFRIFVSFGVPESVLLNLDKVARKIGAKLVIRGLKNNSFKETISTIKAMNESHSSDTSQSGVVIDIDPKAFEEFGVHAVPSFVLSNGHKFDKIVGNLSIPYVLGKFADSGDLKDEAKQFLNRLKNENH